MPREQINYPDLFEKDRQIELRKTPSPDGLTSDYGPWNESSLHIGWQGVEAATAPYKIGWVQVGLEVDVEYARMALESRNGVRDDRTVMWTPTMSPAEVDKIIATLKRAKRKAFRK